MLIIEDEPLVALDIEAILEEAGATSFDIAVSEAEAVALAMARQPRLITSDVQLLEGTGPRAVGKILDEFGAVPVIFITGTPEDCDRCERSAVVLTKPLRSHELTAAFLRFAPLAG